MPATVLGPADSRYVHSYFNLSRKVTSPHLQRLIKRIPTAKLETLGPRLLKSVFIFYYAISHLLIQCLSLLRSFSNRNTKN